MPSTPENDVGEAGNVGTALVQFAVVLVALILLNKFLVRKTEGG